MTSGIDAVVFAIQTAPNRVERHTPQKELGDEFGLP